MHQFLLDSDLAQNHVIALQRGEDQGWSPLRLTEAGEWKVQDDDVALYKSPQAESSSGLSQSLAREVSAASTGTAASECASLMARRNARSLSRSRSGKRSSSRVISSRLPILPIWYGRLNVPPQPVSPAGPRDARGARRIDAGTPSAISYGKSR